MLFASDRQRLVVMHLARRLPRDGRKQTAGMENDMKEKNRFDWAKEVGKLQKSGRKKKFTMGNANSSSATLARLRRTYPGLMGESKGETFRAWWLTA